MLFLDKYMIQNYAIIYPNYETNFKSNILNLFAYHKHIDLYMFLKNIIIVAKQSFTSLNLQDLIYEIRIITYKDLEKCG